MAVGGIAEAIAIISDQVDQDAIDTDIALRWVEDAVVVGIAGATAAFHQVGNRVIVAVQVQIVGLAVAVAIHVDPEVLLVDEALAVGDIYFRQRCMRKVHELRSRGVTILFVSHAIGDVKAIGDQTLWLEKGQVRELGPTDVVVQKYLAAMVEKDSVYLTSKQRVPNSVVSDSSKP